MCNEEIAVKGRVGKKLPMHSSPKLMLAVEKQWKVISDYTYPLFMRHVERVSNPMPREEWLKTFPGGKQRIFRRIMETGVDEREPEVVDAFIKREKANRDDVMQASLLVKDPRWIQGSHPSQTLAIGRYVRQLSKHLNALAPEAWAIGELRYEHKHFVQTSGKSNEDIGRLVWQAEQLILSACDGDEDVVWVMDDESRFDLHLTKGPFGALQRVYSSLLPKHVAKRLRRTKKTRGRSKYGSKTSVPYTMTSGKPDTSCGDGIANICLKANFHRLGRKWVTIICGDDSITLTTDKELAFLLQYHGCTPNEVYARAGMEIDFSTSKNYLDAEFCSCRFMRGVDTYVLVPKTGKILARIGWDTKQRNAQHSEEWLRGIGITLSNFSHDPVLQALSERILNHVGTGRTITEINRYARFFNRPTTVPHLDQLEYFGHHYGYSEADLSAATKVIKEHPIFDSKIDDAMINHMCLTDV
jgi:hypothetical protein